MIPWVLTDSNYVRSTSQKLDPNRTIFVGGLHGMINAGRMSEAYSEPCEISKMECFGETVTAKSL